MTNNSGNKSEPYEEVENWPPYTYTEYPDVTTENIHEFTEFHQLVGATGQSPLHRPKKMNSLYPMLGKKSLVVRRKRPFHSIQREASGKFIPLTVFRRD